MSRIACRDTKPEVALRRELWRRGYRFRVNYRLSGRPDIVFPKQRVAVFVDGCFWHHCPLHYQAPASNAEFWREKIAMNVARDERVNEELSLAGWHVVRVWEHEIREAPLTVVRRVGVLVESLRVHSRRTAAN